MNYEEGRYKPSGETESGEVFSENEQQKTTTEEGGGRDIELSDGITAMVDKSDAQHIANSTRSAEEKARLSEIEKIIKRAKYYNEVDAVHNKFNRFRYYEMPVRYENTTSFITVNVGKGKTDGKYHIYDLTEPKERNTPNRINGFGRPVGNALGKGVSNYSIPNSSETVKEKFSLPETRPTTDSSMSCCLTELYAKFKKRQSTDCLFSVFIKDIPSRVQVLK